MNVGAQLEGARIVAAGVLGSFAAGAMTGISEQLMTFEVDGRRHFLYIGPRRLCGRLFEQPASPDDLREDVRRLSQLT